MSRPRRLALVAAALMAAGRPAAAQHDHSGHTHDHGGHGDPARPPDGGAACEAAPCPDPADAPAPRSSFEASIGVLAARYDATLYEGDYEGLAVTARWSRGRLAASAGITGYSLQRNGKRLTGVGDLMLHGHATVAQAGAVAVGAMLMVMAPTGDHQAGLGMGHVMLMPGAWIAWSPSRLSLGASAGYSRGLGDAGGHADHGAWPLVDPMAFAELTLGATAQVSLSRALRASARLDGAVAIDVGASRLAAAARATWTRGRVDTSAELAAGLAGAPFDVRGLVEAAVRFE